MASKKKGFPREKLLQHLRDICKDKQLRIASLKDDIAFFSRKSSRTIRGVVRGRQVLQKELHKTEMDIAALQWALIELQRGDP